MQLRCIRGCRAACGCHRGQRIDVDEDRLRGVLRELDRLGHHHGDGLADIAHPICRERSLRRARRGRAVTMFPRHSRHVLDAGCIEVRRRDDHVHAGHLACTRSVDRAQLAVRHPAAHHDAVELAGAIQVVGIAALTAQQHRVLLARDRLADGKFLVHQQCWVERRIHQGCFREDGAAIRNAISCCPISRRRPRGRSPLAAAMRRARRWRWPTGVE